MLPHGESYVELTIRTLGMAAEHGRAMLLRAAHECGSEMSDRWLTIAVPMADQAAKVLGVMSDLFFTVKVMDAAKKCGSSAEFVKDVDRVMEKARGNPPLIVLDLNYGDPVGLIARLKSDPGTAAIPLVGFVSHVQVQLRQDALNAGCDVVVPRSVFSEDVQSILGRYLGVGKN